jgi:hypothetical protein
VEEETTTGGTPDWLLVLAVSRAPTDSIVLVLWLLYSVLIQSGERVVEATRTSSRELFQSASLFQEEPRLRPLVAL